MGRRQFPSAASFVMCVALQHHILLSFPHVFLVDLNSVFTANSSNSHINYSIPSPCPLSFLCVTHHCPTQFFTLCCRSQFRSPIITTQQSVLLTDFNNFRICDMVFWAHGDFFLPLCDAHGAITNRLHTDPSSRTCDILAPTHPDSNILSAILRDRSVTTSVSCHRDWIFSLFRCLRSFTTHSSFLLVLLFRVLIVEFPYPQHIDL